MFDSLDTRIVLDSSAIATGVPLAATVLAASGSTPLPGENEPIMPDTGSTSDGTSPSTTDDLSNPPLPIAYQTAASMATN
jgi:hypothetical protein